MNNRIGLLLKVKDVTASKFAEMIGVQPSNISHILSGRNKPSLDFITKVVETFPDISLEWLMFGKGSMFHHEADTIPSQKISDSSESKPDISESTTESQLPDLFSQDYLTEKTIFEEKNYKSLNIEASDIETLTEQNLLSENAVENEVTKVTPEIQVSKGIDKSDEVEKDQTENQGMKQMKPRQIVLIYPDETFKILNLSDKKL